MHIFAILTLTFLAGPQEPAQKATSPEAVYRRLIAWFDSEMARLNREKQDPNLALAGFNRKCKEAAAAFSLESIEPKQCYWLAKLCESGRMPRATVRACNRYLTADLDSEQRFLGQLKLMDAYSTLNDVDGLYKTTMAMSPPRPVFLSNLAGYLANDMALTVGEKRGLKAGLEMVEHVERLLPAFPPTAKDDLFFYYRSLTSLAGARADLLENVSRRKEAIDVLNAALTRVPDADHRVSLERKLASIEILGEPAPEITYDRKLGDFTGLGALRGKVVLLEFFAHW